MQTNPASMSPEATAQDLVRALVNAGVTPQEIAKQLGVSWRSVYRWERAENQPQRKSDLEHLRELAEQLAK